MADAPETQNPGAAVPIAQDAVIAELLSDPLGRALYERAQYKVATDALVTQRAELFDRIRELETQRRDVTDA